MGNRYQVSTTSTHYLTHNPELDKISNNNPLAITYYSAYAVLVVYLFFNITLLVIDKEKHSVLPVPAFLTLIALPLKFYFHTPSGGHQLPIICNILSDEKRHSDQLQMGPNSQ
eukprot:TRINITY_DN30148_c0_g1_i1.p1 TRINITY_DN30148_c0_g1~~TRINITY_DN30148_c0_g1_i1.p1  ORF type:complete len:113 (+),score=0.25 TRINITY_DN30148_c0_g1_i1:193-531(+)